MNYSKKELPKNKAKEQKAFFWVNTFFSLAIISSIAISFQQDYGTWAQLNILGHILTGSLFFIQLPIYTYYHIKRISNIKRLLVNTSGVITVISILFYFISVILFTYTGQIESNENTLIIHKYGSYFFISLIFLHVILFKFLKTKNKINTQKFKSFTQKDTRIIGISVAIYFITITAGTTLYSKIAEHQYPLIPQVKNYSYSYGKNPFLPSQTATDKENFFLSPQHFTKSEKCGSCHQDIMSQWKSSMHRLAAADPTYVKNINLLTEKKGIEATRYCEGCHAPIALLTGELTPGGKHGGVKDTFAHNEGVGCSSCHNIKSAVHLDGVASYHISPKQSYIFSNSNNTFLETLNRTMIGFSSAKHKKDNNTPFLKDPAFCATCHSQFMDKSMNDWGWVKMQDEYRAWLAGPYSLQEDQSFSSNEKITCQDCHMPLVQSSDPSADKNGLVKSHNFYAANTAIPHLLGDKEQLQNTINFMQKNKMRVSIEEPRRKDAQQNILNISENLRKHSETPFFAYLNESINLNITVSNVGVGHDFPGGTTDLNQAWIDISVVDSQGKEIYKSGRIDEHDYLDEEAYTYESIPIDRNGEHVWKHDLFNMTGESFKRIVKAGKTDVANFKFNIPSWTKSPIIINAVLKYRKLNTQYARWALGKSYTTLPITDLATDTLVVHIITEAPTKK